MVRTCWTPSILHFLKPMLEQTLITFDPCRHLFVDRNWSFDVFVKRQYDLLGVGTCRGLWTQTKRRETRGKRWRLGELTLRRRRSISPSWTPPDTKASSPTWSAERLKLTWLSWWGQSEISTEILVNVTFFFCKFTCTCNERYYSREAPLSLIPLSPLIMCLRPCPRVWEILKKHFFGIRFKKKKNNFSKHAANQKPEKKSRNGDITGNSSTTTRARHVYGVTLKLSNFWMLHRNMKLITRKCHLMPE